MAVSLRPSTYTTGGGLLDDADVTVKEAQFTVFDYNGTVKPAVPALGLTLVTGDGAEHEEYLACGKPEYFLPSKDGKDGSAASDGMGDYLAKMGDKDGLSESSNGPKFLASLINSGFPEDKLDGPISALVGLQFHVKREAVKRTGLVRTGKNANREQTVLTCSKIHKLPWEAASTLPAGVGSAPKAAAPVASTAKKPNGSVGATVSAEVRDKAVEQVMAQVLEHGTVPRAKLVSLVFTATKGDADQKAISQLVASNGFLESIEGIRYDGASVTMV